jgi:hypothetical protein
VSVCVCGVCVWCVCVVCMCVCVCVVCVCGVCGVCVCGVCVWCVCGVCVWCVCVWCVCVSRIHAVRQLKSYNLRVVFIIVVSSAKRYKCEGNFSANPVRCEARLLSVSHRFRSNVD